MTLPPVRRQIILPVDPTEAFEVFTEQINLWWPLDGDHQVFGTGASVAFHDGVLMETSATGEKSPWAEVISWKPAELLVLSWHPGSNPAQSTEVEIAFESVPKAGGGTATLVTLEHRNWERTTNPAANRAEYENGWVSVIQRYGDLSLEPEHTELSYLLLRHTVGPAAPAQGPIFAHPDFGHHAAFLTSLMDKGALVAAGPLDIGSQPGAHGMTVIRVPEDQVAEYIQLARADESVVRGLLSVEPIIWNVMMAGPGVD